MTEDEPAAYLAFALGGVQDFIGAARRTADLWAASTLMSRLSKVAQDSIGPGNTIIPSYSAAAPSPNRVFARVPRGAAAQIGRSAEGAVRAAWRDVSRAVHAEPDASVAAALATFPDIRWVAYEPTPGGDESYESAWHVVREGMDARKRVRTFPGYVGAGRQLCSLCGRRDACSLPSRLRRRRGEALCPVCAVKRDLNAVGGMAGIDATGFPSTASIATAPFKSRVLHAWASAGAHSAFGAAVRAHRDAVIALGSVLGEMGIAQGADPATPGVLRALEARCDQLGAQADLARSWTRQDGDWCYAETWDDRTIVRASTPPGAVPPSESAQLQEACRHGRAALAELRSQLKAAGDEAPPARYLALLLQDADDMGRQLGARDARNPDRALTRERHGEISLALGQAASRSAAELEEHLGRAAYAGGDDLLGFVPLTHAMAAARACRELFGREVGRIIPGAGASTALVCFHKSYPLQEACRRGRAALDAAKHRKNTKDHLAVVALRRGGERAQLIAPWTRRGLPVTEAVARLSDAFSNGLAPSFAYDVYRERAGLASLAQSGPRNQHHEEIGRLLARHGNSEALEAVLALEPASDGVLDAAAVAEWVGALDVALFFNREAR